MRIGQGKNFKNQNISAKAFIFAEKTLILRQDFF